VVHHHVEGAADSGRARVEVQRADDLHRTVAVQAIGVPGAGDGGHLRAGFDGELDHDASHRTARPVDENGLACLDPGELDRGLASGQPGKG
jgi:hypothetical protein